MKFIALFIAFLFLSNHFFSQTEKKSLLWEVKNKEGKTCSYLFGTIHVIEESKFYFPKKLDKIVSKCDAICLEIAGITENVPSMDRMMMRDKKLNELFTKNQMDSIYQWADKTLFMKPKQFDENFGSVKPFLLLQFILTTSLPENTKSYELELEQLAKKQNKKILGLETVDFQLSLFDNMPIHEQVQMILESLKELESSKKKFAEMEELYLQQDLDRLSELSKESSNYLNRSFLEDRNLDWIPKIENMMKDKVVFVAVGAAHLAGQEGVIELLIKNGYHVLPVKL
jgi:uncharacterized protein YbaP (TraB family)